MRNPTSSHRVAVRLAQWLPGFEVDLPGMCRR
jgi:hypothetical protein